MGRGYIDKRMGGIYRDRDDGSGGGGIDPGSITNLEEYITNIVNNAITNNNATINNLLTELYQTIQGDIYNAGDQITQQMIDYYTSIITQLEEILNEYNFGDETYNYISNLIENIQNTINNLILGDNITQEDIDNIWNTINEIVNNYYGIDPSVLEDIKNYIDTLIENLRQEIYQIGDEITQQMIDYYNELLTTINNLRQEFENYVQVNEDWKTYLENLYTDLYNYVNNLVLSEVLTEEIKNYIDNLFNEIQEILQQFIDDYLTENLEEFVTEIINQYFEEGKYTRWISGSYTWLGNLDFVTTVLEYLILGQSLKAPVTNITIPDNLEANPRYAVIYADIYGQVGYLLGAAAAAPAVPVVDPSTQIALTTIYIPALGTEPGTDPDGNAADPDEIVIYDENIEWATAKTEAGAITVDFEDETNPANGAKHISVAAAAGVSGWVLLSSVVTNPSGTGRSGFSIEVSSSSVLTALSNMLSDNNVDYVKDGIRHVIYYQIDLANPPKAVFTNRETGEKFNAYISSVYSWKLFEIAELGLSVQTPLVVRFKSYVELPAGSYSIALDKSNLLRTELQYVYSDDANVTTGEAEISFTNAEAVTAADANLILSLLTTVQWLDNTGLILELYNGASKVGQIGFVSGNYYGFNPKLTGEYQRITIPVSDFNLVGNQFNKLVMRPANTWPGASSLYIDYIVLQTGLALPSVDEPVKIGDWIEDQAFDYRDVEANGEYILDISASYKYKILEAVLMCDAGTITVKIQVNGIDVLSGLSVDTTVKYFTPDLSEIQVLNNQQVKLVITALASASALVGKIRTVRF